MPRSLAAQLDGTEQQTLPSPSGRTAKAGLKPELPGTLFREVPLQVIVKDVVQERVKQEAAAESMDISAGRLSSKLTDGSLTLAQLDKLGDEVIVPVAERILEQRGRSPVAVLRQQVREARRALDIIEQGIDYFAD